MKQTIAVSKVSCKIDSPTNLDFYYSNNCIYQLIRKPNTFVPTHLHLEYTA